MSVKVEFEGVGEVLRRASLFNNRVRDDVAAAVKRSAQNVKKTARSNVRRRSNRLRNSITVKDTSKRANSEKGLAKTVHTRSKKGGNHGHLVELGTNRRSHPIFGNSGRMPAKPFMRPAEAAEEGRFQSELRRIAKKNEII